MGRTYSNNSVTHQQQQQGNNSPFSSSVSNLFLFLSPQAASARLLAHFMREDVTVCEAVVQTPALQHLARMMALTMHPDCQAQALQATQALLAEEPAAAESLRVAVGDALAAKLRVCSLFFNVLLCVRMLSSSPPFL